MKVIYDWETIAPKIVETKDLTISEAAKVLGLSRDQIIYRREKLGLPKKTSPLSKEAREALKDKLIETKGLYLWEAAEILGLTEQQVIYARHQLGITDTGHKLWENPVYQRLYEPEVRKLTNKEAAKALGVSTSQVAKFRLTHHLRRDDFACHGKLNHNWQPVGTRKIAHDVDGSEFWALKLKEDRDYSKAWIPEHRYVWEQAHGKLTKHWHILHLNGDKLDNELSNLYAVSPQAMARLCQNHWFFKNEPERQMYAIKIAELIAECSKQGFDYPKYYNDLKKQKKRRKHEEI